MSWMTMLYQTYENNVAMIAKYDGKQPLCPKGHVVKNAQIEITINLNGDFLKAIEVNKDDAKTIIPVTESSASRAGKAIFSHPISDSLEYISGDLYRYLKNKKDINDSINKYEYYIKELELWSNSEFSHPKVKSVYNYVSKKCMISDLIKSGIIECNENGEINNKKISGQDYKKCLVRFIINSSIDDLNSGTWQDSSLMEKYSEYYSSIQEVKRDVCYLKGEEEIISVNHPKGIIASDYGAKLISANDTSNFTFRGRFLNSEEACTVSYEATQKAHNALTWIASRQGYNVGNTKRRTFVCWNPKGKKVPDFENPFGAIDDKEEVSNTEEHYKRKLMDALKGYKLTLDDNDDIVIIALDAATTGRLSITYYNELKSSDFLDRLKLWYENCCWYFKKFNQDKKPFLKVEHPSNKQIVEYSFGTQQKEYIEVNDRVMKEQVQRILNCILNSQPVPRDIIHAITIKASTPLSYSRGNRERILSTACALIRKYYFSKGVEIKMKLDLEEKDRSYLFGRLLAVFEKVERSTFTSDEAREPNAIRFQSAFVNHPMHTWLVIEEKLNPYFQKLKPGSRKYYKDIISSITINILEKDKSILNTSLDEKYLIGYYLQRMELNKYNKESNEMEEE